MIKTGKFALIGMVLLLVACSHRTPKGGDIEDSAGRLNPDRQSESWGPTTEDLRMSTSVDKNSVDGNIGFTVSIQNVGDKDVILNLGIMLANGRKQYPTEIHPALVDSKGVSRDLRSREPGIVAGRVDDYLVPLRIGSTYTVSLRLEDYWCPATEEFQLKLAPGEYYLSARLEGKGARSINRDTEGSALMGFWEGNLESGTVGFRIDGE